MPVTTFHSTMDRPERVSLTKPPKATIRKINKLIIKSHRPIIGFWRFFSVIKRCISVRKIVYDL